MNNMNTVSNNYLGVNIDHINDIDEFLDMVDRCSNTIYMDDSENEYDLKHDPVVRRVMRSVCGRGWHGILNLHVSRPDMDHVVGYMMGQ